MYDSRVFSNTTIILCQQLQEAAGGTQARVAWTRTVEMVHLPAVEGSNLMTGGVIWVSLGHLKVGELSPPSLLVSHEYCISLCLCA